MGRPLVAILFALAIYLTLYRSAVVAFVTLYLPALLLLNTTQKINLPGLPDMNVTFGIVYGILGGLVLKGGERFPFKWGFMDTLMLLLTLSTIITGMITEYVYTGVSILGEQVLQYLAPYFLARIMFHDPAMRRRALWICVACAFVISFFALIELRLWPYWLSRTLVIFFVIGLFCGFIGMTYHLYNVDIDARRQQAQEDVGQTATDSMFVRAMIVQKCMPFASTSGLFGWGNTIRHSQLALESVDNSYMLFTMRRGFVFLVLFLMIPVVVAIRSMRAFWRARLTTQWMPLAVGVSAILGIMAAMYTVWFGFAYSVMWVVMIGVTMSMCDVL